MVPDHEVFMGAEERVRLIQLTSDGELSAVACSYCGHISLTSSERCERCNVRLPEPPSLLRLQLEQLRRSDAKKNESAPAVTGFGKLSLFVLIILVLLSIVVLLTYLLSHAPLI